MRKVALHHLAALGASVTGYAVAGAFGINPTLPETLAVGITLAAVFWLLDRGYRQ